ncbi:HesA/MoeB/ThiF family protein [Polynucleobacter victoriensis]|uniref:Molybdopterin or thiamine biosynthesis adenylyltransferase n=1 Tax=Polynucleobacter victoriensis TaxID=2049319 RepID=A0A212TDR2_9BURK|nr:molybdopterin-synthase adenylyltransferase MoeB [Polynucleobacter victoriensis]SNC64162.1 Molybdopterin or thiamine biosynthesis adenylyltransferase [Polynucleobacter victoriensis]
MNDQDLLRYSRHILLDDIGIEGQEKILAAHAIVIGAGGLGSAAAPYLAAAGVGKITLIDHDTVDLTNLQRQIMHNQNSVGQAKVQSGKAMLLNLNPHVQVNALQEKATAELLDQLLPTASVVLDCSDNFTTRHMVNAACVKHKVPLVSGAAIKFDGQVTVIDPRQTGTPCYACLFPADQEFNEVQCSTMGVFSPLVGIIGSIQAAEALQVIMQIGEPLVGKLLLWDARSSQVDQIALHQRDDCPICSRHQ